ncbi:MAG: hypothetical protein A2283_20640 [Lentisphaerae bacterium RIFOXYA12_FULL_48_11]|nr:MAG: hypothetical protein A2283_20640 [Lentisphaerae bacterium RIFOXYA12_FULL_48_11]
MLPRQLIVSIILSTMLLILVIRLVQKQRLDIAYCWLWLAIGLASLVVVIKYEWLTKLSEIIGSLTNTTTLFLLGFFVVLMMCLQFSLVISSQRRQIKKLCQQMAILTAELQKNKHPSNKDNHG